MPSRKNNQPAEDESPTPVEAARERLITRQHNALARSFYEEHGKMLEVFDGLAKSIQALPAPKPPKSVVQPNGRRAMVLLYSDSHCGLHVDSKRLGGFGGFNESIWRARHERLRAQVTLAQKMFQVDDFVCLALGDLIDGQDIFKSQPFEIDHNVPEQMVLAAQQFGFDLTYYSGLFRHITVSCVFGNHGRKGRFGENPYAVNYEQVVYELAKAYAGNCENILWSINEAWFQLVDILGTTFLTMHGDDVRGTAATLLGNAAKVRMQYREMTGCQFDYLCLGHHHRHLASEDILINGSFVGASEFTAKNLRAVSMPSQKLLIIEEGVGITWSANIPLASWSELKNVETFYPLA